MATIQSTMAINDKMTSVIQKIIDNMNKMISVTEDLASRTKTAVSPVMFDELHSGADLASAGLKEIAEGVNRTANAVSAATPAFASISTSFQTSTKNAGAMLKQVNSVNAALNTVRSGKTFKELTAGAQVASRELNKLQKAIIKTANDAAAMSAPGSVKMLVDLQNQADQASRELTELQQDMARTGNAAAGAMQGINGMGGALKMLSIAAIVAGLKKAGGAVAEFADSQTRNTARLEIMLDTGQAEAQLKQDVAKYQAIVDQAANRARADTTDFANAAANFGINAPDAFSNMNQVVGFTEQLQKHFAIAGTSAQGAAGASLQLQQALSMGVLRGQELRSVMENAPTLIQAIADYMGKPRGEIKALAEDGLITAAVITNAMAAAADETNRKFESMPMTFEQMGILVKNSATESFRPIMAALTTIAKSQAFDRLQKSATQFFTVVANIATFIVDNWTTISGVLGIVGAALAGYVVVMGVAKGAALAMAIAEGVKTAATTLASAVTGKLTAAQWSLNAAMAANPIMLIVMLVFALIAAMVFLVSKFKQSESTIGAVFGSVTMAIGAVGTFFKAVGLSIAGAWNKLWDNAELRWLEFQNIISKGVAFLLEKLLGLINLLNKIPGIKIDTSWVDGAIASTQAKLDSRNARILEIAEEKNNESSLDKFMKDPGARWDAVWSEWDETGKDKWWAYGYDAGAKTENAVKDIMDGFDFGGDMGDGIGGVLDDIAGNTAATARNTSDASEELVWLRDIAEREAINRVSISNIDVNMSGMQNSFGSDLDVDGFTGTFITGLREAMNNNAEGVHA